MYLRKKKKNLDVVPVFWNYFAPCAAEWVGARDTCVKLVRGQPSDGLSRYLCMHNDGPEFILFRSQQTIAILDRKETKWCLQSQMLIALWPPSMYLHFNAMPPRT